MSIAFSKFKEIEQLSSMEEKQKAWLKDYEGLGYSIAVAGVHKIKWLTNPVYYKDDEFDIRINCIKELKNRTRIEFDDKNDRGEKDKDKILKNINLTISKLKENNIGFIRSTHNGASDYLWVEFNKEATDKEKEKFLMWIAPDNSEIDLNFASSRKVFPVLYARHWKHSLYHEEPVEYLEGEQIDLLKLNIKVEKGTINKRKIRNRSFEYITGIKDASKVFNLANQVDRFNELQPIFYDKAGLFWLWNAKEFKWEIVDEVDLLNVISDNSGSDIISSRSRAELINSLKQKGRKNIPKPVKKFWIQFKDTIYDIENLERIPASPDYFIANPIPYKVSYNSNTPVMDRIFEEWVGKEHVKTLYEILAYCLLQDYPIHRIFCFIGGGMNGKSKFLELLRKFIGSGNCCSTELDTLIASRFEVTRLHKKLVCQMGETNFNEISKTSILKKLSGGDLIGFEYKNKNPFEERNYAKILISTNNLPTTTDKTIGFYRRWLILDFPNQFTEKKDILGDIPEEEYSNLATKCLMILNELLEKREFTNEGTIEERTKKYEDHSDPLEKFLKEFIVEDYNGFIWKFEFEKRLNEWCKENKFRTLSEVAIGKKMKDKEIKQDLRQAEWLQDGRNNRIRAWIGLKWRNCEQDEQDEQVKVT